MHVFQTLLTLAIVNYVFLILLWVSGHFHTFPYLYGVFS